MNFDQLDFARLHRAHGLLADALGTSKEPPTREAHAKAFIQYARTVASNQKAGLAEALESHPNPLVRKAAAHTLQDGAWANPDAATLARNYVETISEGSLLDQIARHARVIPVNQRNVLIASGTSGEATAEGHAKVVRKLALAVDTETAKKVAAIAVLSNELMGAAGSALFERELRESVIRATNEAVLDDLAGGTTVGVSATGDPILDLRAGLAAAGPSHGYVVAMPAGAVAEIATRNEAGPGFTVRGGEFRPGINIIGIDDIDETIVIPASRIALWLGDLEVRRSGEGTVNMADTPTSPSSTVSLWQTKCTGLIAERQYHLFLGGATTAIVHGSP